MADTLQQNVIRSHKFNTLRGCSRQLHLNTRLLEFLLVCTACVRLRLRLSVAMMSTCQAVACLIQSDSRVLPFALSHVIGLPCLGFLFVCPRFSCAPVYFVACGRTPVLGSLRFTLSDQMQSSGAHPASVQRLRGSAAYFWFMFHRDDCSSIMLRRLRAWLAHHQPACGVWRLDVDAVSARVPCQKACGLVVSSIARCSHTSPGMKVRKRQS